MTIRPLLSKNSMGSYSAGGGLIVNRLKGLISIFMFNPPFMGEMQ
jgi:hypothetical protein